MYTDLFTLKVSSLYEKRVKKKVFWMLRNLTVGPVPMLSQTLALDLSRYLNIYSRESIFLWEEKRFSNAYLEPTRTSRMKLF